MAFKNILIFDPCLKGYEFKKNYMNLILHVSKLTECMFILRCTVNGICTLATRDRFLHANVKLIYIDLKEDKAGRAELKGGNRYKEKRSKEIRVIKC